MRDAWYEISAELPAAMMMMRTTTTAAVIVCLFGCEQGAESPVVTAAGQGYLPRAIADLKATQAGSVTLEVSLNGVGIDSAFTVSGSTTPVRLGQDQLLSGSNTVSVTFYFESDQVSRRVFASGTQSFDYDGSAVEIELSGLDYRYIDSDRDGIYDVHELAVEPADVDNDQQLNVDDDDSDNDLLTDGQDLTPWGPGSDGHTGALLAQIPVQLPDGRTQQLLVDHITGSSGETARLEQLGQALLIDNPAGWPGSALLPEPASTRWSAFEWRVNSEQGLCTGFDIPLAVTSLKLKSSATALLYFERYTGPARLTTLPAVEISDLDRYAHEAPFDGDGPLNDALRLVLVPQFHVGWIDLWTEANFSGEACSVSLTTPTAY